MAHSLILYVLLAAGLAASLILFLSLKREIFAQGRRERVHAVHVEAMFARLKEMEVPAPQPVFMPQANRSGMNLTRRVQALRLLRRGEDVAHIAAALEVPRREVELLVRVYQATRAAAAGADSSDS